MALIKIDQNTGIPLVGAIAFGIIDRGTNLIQVRATTVCNQKCTYCSTNANNNAVHPVNFEVDVDYLLAYVKEVVTYKGTGIEANIDSVGEPTAYPHLVKLVHGLKKIAGIQKVSMQTNGSLLTQEKIIELEKAGLDHMNLSINTFDAELAKKLSGLPTYDLERIKQVAHWVAGTKIQLLLAPVWFPDVNEQGIRDLITFAKQLNAKIGIQKYEIYAYSRKVRGVKPITYWQFYKKLEELEREFDVQLIVKASDFGISKAKRLPTKMDVGDKIHVETKIRGWGKDQMIGSIHNRAVTINNCSKQGMVRARVVENKNNIYLAEIV